MNFTKLIEHAGNQEWAKQVIARLVPYPYLADAVLLLLGLAIGTVVALGAFFILERVLLRLYRRHCDMSEELWRCLRNMSVSLVSCLPLYTVAYCAWNDGMHEWVAVLTIRLIGALTVISLATAVVYGIRSFGLWYRQQRNAEQRPIGGLLNVAVGFVWAGAAVLCVSIVLDKSPVYLLSGLGAVAAILMLLFQQSILSLVASVRVNTNRLVEIGDWIAMESEGVDGCIEEISLHTLKVRNWDRSLVCMPICDLVNKPFVNYEAMVKCGGRRIKRSIRIDQRSIRFLTGSEVDELKGFDLLKGYLVGREEEISNYNVGRTRFNTRHLSNLGTFRMYVQHYLENDPSIRLDLPLIVRELEPTSTGLPLEIYCFCKEVDWIPFERIQSRIMEHLLAVLPNFRLRVFQECSDIYQEIGSQVDIVGGAFRFERLKNPESP